MSRAPRVAPPRSAFCLARLTRLVTLACALSLLGLLGFPGAASAEGVDPLRFRPKLELPLLGILAVGWIATEALKPKLAPKECRLCGANRLDETVSEHVRWHDVEPAARFSDLLLMGAVPAAAYGSTLALALAHGTRKTALEDVVILTEALVLTGALTQLTKLTVGRERPYVHTQREENRDFVAGPDDHLSFFSGHTSSTFALAVATATTATLRGYKEAPWVWGIGAPLAAFTGYFRMAADRHYLTDVVTGALVGSAVGALVPWLHTLGREQNERMPLAVGGPPSPSLTMTWVH